MKFITGCENAKPVFKHIFWGDHWPGCEKCREIDIEKSAIFVRACVIGSQLLSKELIKRQAPIVAKKRDEVKKWAEKAGCFKI